MVLNFRRVSPAEECEDRSLYFRSFRISESRVRSSKRTAFKSASGQNVETRFKSLAAGTPGDKPRAPAAATKSRSPRSHSRGVSMLLTRVARLHPHGHLR